MPRARAQQNEGLTTRELYATQAALWHPDVPPRDDFEVLALGTSQLAGRSATEKREWLEQQRTQIGQLCGSLENALASTTAFLNQAAELTGRKPSAGDRDVRYLPIPRSDYALRLWPGSLLHAEYCLDFVDTRTGQAVNVPTEHEIWAIPDPTTPWLQTATCLLASAERAYGIPVNEIKPGEEKYILRDGLACQLSINGQKIMRFEVPTRLGAGGSTGTDSVAPNNPFVLPQQTLPPRSSRR
ncbi:hypothetical protein FKP32DRAFT_1617967 [Trametes sanguinea]|nr:hypothetical protein FKP32DRAFT_1617967 [Trametes sanguinea]